VTLLQLRRVRWAVRAVLALAIAASITGNVLHARDNLISQSISAWPPLAFLLTVELMSRVPIHRRSLAGLRLAAMVGIAGIAAWVSYWHQVAICSRYGETGAAPYLIPLTIDGMVVVGSVSLVELAGRIRGVGEAAEPVPAQSPNPVPDAAELILPLIEALPMVVEPPTDPPDEPEQTPEPDPDPVPAGSNGKRRPPVPDRRILARLRDPEAVPRRSDGTVPVRLVEDLFGARQERAVKLLEQAGLYRSGDDEPVPANGHQPVPADTEPTPEGAPA
jgi:hypothetical protein